jgi:uncharacterized protein (TIGR03382 family)
MKKITILALALCTALAGPAQASVISVAGVAATSPILSSGDAYLAAVDAALLAGPSLSTSVTSLDWISHGSLFGGNSNFAMKTTVNFGVASAGVWSFRAGVDFGLGGVMAIDGVVVDFKNNDMWWAGGYGSPSEYFAASTALSAGNHVLTIAGFENCCDGGQQVQFKQAGSNSFVSFASNDTLDAAAIPEPGSISLALMGAGLLGLSRRRKPAAGKA